MYIAGEVNNTEGDVILQFMFDEGEMSELIYSAKVLDLKQEDTGNKLLAYNPHLLNKAGLEVEFKVACEENEVSHDTGYTLLQLAVHNALAAAVDIEKLMEDCECGEPHDET